MEEEIINLLQYKLEKDGEDDDIDYKNQLEEDTIQFIESNLENQDERLVEYSENLQELCVYAIIFCITNIFVLMALKSKKVNFNQIFGFRAHSQMVQNVMWLMIFYCGYIILQYLSSLLELQNISNFCFAIKYINLILITIICKIFYNKMKEDGVFFLSQIKYQKDISFIMVFISDQLLTLAPFIMKHVYLINFLLRVDIPAYKFQVYGLVISKLIRIYQCIKLYQADPYKNKDLLSNVEIQNCIKYLVSLMCTILDQFLVYRISVDCGLLISHVCYSIYTYYWDVYEDWQLNINGISYFSSDEFIKTRKPLFNKKMYIFSLIFNGLVRLNWAIKYIFNFNHYEVDYYVYCFEISRRSLWNLLKLDCEQYLLKEKSEQKMKGNEVELSSISTSVKIIIDENSPIKQNSKDDQKNN
ncbi:EXS family protein (macronuclear) [Tetrahymena thermophila SB210]|uniref:EXS family protein n=1 Tax=Tetrahymena thermophila (strain SB210) TaxID=312017 RepID=I7M6N5_TETTS|nr:EXS family protein [Tetrahymena thermophila SB210]EAR85535.3 EXS family protein [Tetrahymena thermophila SB210]|eukprot:XP_001033198.3 EXS family protein [Tetrahymena thermophila SB210]